VTPLSRRSFLAAGAGAVLLAACGGSDGSSSGGSDSSAQSLALVRFFADGTLEAGSRQRLVLGLADSEGLITSGAPAALTLLVSRDGRTVGGPVTAERHDAGLPRPYYPAYLELADEGVYDVTTEVDGTEAASAFTIVAPGADPVPGVGDALIPVETPTFDDDRGVDPICTAEPTCPLHDVTLTQALTEGRPLALLIATPAFCQTAICGPVLDVLLSQQERFPGVHLLHGEVYTRPDPNSPTTPVVDAYRLTFEPVLFLAGPDGVITDRFDGIFDQVELADALGRLPGSG